MSNRRTLIISLLTAATVAVSHDYARSADNKPTLFLNITVEGLSEDYLEMLRNVFGNEGFNRLRDKGVVFPDVVYGPGVDATAATAVIVTGTTASHSNIPADTYFDAQTRQSRPILEDANRQLSPATLAVSTIGDEIRIAEGGINNVYSLAANPRQAVILAGHAGNAALWIDDASGRWTTSSFYKDVPTVITGANFSSPLSSRIDTIRWAPALDINAYPGIPSYKKAYPFKYAFTQNGKNSYRAFKASAKGNDELIRQGESLITSMKMGGGDKLDMLSIACTVAPYPYSKDFDSRLEILDSYVRLDKSLAALFKAIDEKGPGMNRTVVALTGIPAPNTGKRDDERFNIPYGQFSPRKAISLLNVYLMAIYGNGDWVSGYHEGQFHLNRKLIKDRDVDEAAIRRQTAEFLKRMAGVCEAYTLDDILAGNAQTEQLRRNVAMDYAGDVFITVTPGWEIVDENNTQNNSRSMVSRLSATSYPAFILVPDVAPKTISGETDACVLAPTLARILRIRSPNAAASSPVRIK
ncbi:MAG: alkaline phosphatase family protein [Muribaculaceae bacterium]|nr:alkaline phosphatase family protein [Muribaculaceae bacterium]